MKVVPPKMKGYVIALMFSLLGIEISRWIIVNVIGISFESDYGIYLIFMKMIGLTGLGWFTGHLMSLKLSKIFFNLSRIKILHSVFSFKQIELQNIFTTNEHRSYFIKFILVFFSCHAFASFVSYVIMIPYTQAGYDQETIDFLLLLMVGAVTPIVVTVVFPIMILFSSNIRLIIKEKHLVSSSFSPFKYLIFSIVGISAFLNALLSISNIEGDFSMLYFTWVPSLLLTILFVSGSMEPLTSEFRQYLNSLGIKDKTI